MTHHRVDRIAKGMVCAPTAFVGLTEVIQIDREVAGNRIGSSPSRTEQSEACHT
jgi:hypothetical protein